MKSRPESGLDLSPSSISYWSRNCGQMTPSLSIRFLISREDLFGVRQGLQGKCKHRNYPHGVSKHRKPLSAPQGPQGRSHGWGHPVDASSSPGSQPPAQAGGHPLATPSVQVGAGRCSLLGGAGVHHVSGQDSVSWVDR